MGVDKIDSVIDREREIQERRKAILEPPRIEQPYPECPLDESKKWVCDCLDKDGDGIFLVTTASPPYNGDELPPVVCVTGNGPTSEAHMKFIVHAPDDIDYLLAALREGREERDRLRPKTVVLCGSSRFVDIMAVCAWLIERDEKAIAMGLHLLPGWYCKDAIPDHLAEHEGCAAEMDELHLRKIDIADEIFVVNCNDYIGDSTRKEVEYAMEHGKKIRWFTHDPVGERVVGIITEARAAFDQGKEVKP